MAGRAVAGVFFGGAVDSQLGLGNNGNEGFYLSAGAQSSVPNAEDLQ